LISDPLQRFLAVYLVKRWSRATNLLPDYGKQRSVSIVRNKERTQENMMQKFDTPAPISAVLDITAGRIQFIAADRADTVVEIRPADAGKSRDVQIAEQTTVTYADGVLRITTPAAKNQLFGPSGSLEVAFEGAYDRIKLDEAASVRLTAIDGDVEVGRLTGPAEITTARGDIRIAEARRGKVVLSTQSGHISIGAAPGVSAALDAGTGYGRISSALKNDGAADLTIHATTAYGDITARSL
jgi:hypothetical protein